LSQKQRANNNSEFPNRKTCPYFVMSFLVGHICGSYNHCIVVFRRTLAMSSSAATSVPIGVLIADSNRMQAQLLISALLRHSEFQITACDMDIGCILRSASDKSPQVAVLSLGAQVNVMETVMTLRRFHLSHPEIPKILLAESVDRALVVSAFR